MDYSLSDIASAAGGMDGANSWWIIILFVLIFGANGFGRTGEFGQFATSASQNEILLGQKFDALGQKVNSIGDGICSSTYALNNAIQGEGRALQTQISNDTASINATTVAQTQKILDAMAQNKIDALQSEVNTLKTQNMFCGIPRINPYGYGVYAYNNGCNGCGCGNI